MGLRTPNLAGEDRRPTLEEREPEAAVHLLVKHIKGGGSRRPDQGRRGRGQGVIVITAGSSGPPALRDTPFGASPAPALWVGVDNFLGSSRVSGGYKLEFAVIAFTASTYKRWRELRKSRHKCLSHKSLG